MVPSVELYCYPMETETSTINRQEVTAKENGDRKKDDDNADQENDKEAPSASTSGSFECNICLDQAHDAVVSKCGHLFCWPCLHKWFETNPSNNVCPVCKAAISKDSVSALFDDSFTVLHLCLSLILFGISPVIIQWCSNSIWFPGNPYDNNEH